MPSFDFHRQANFFSTRFLLRRYGEDIRLSLNHDESAVDLRGMQLPYFHPVRNLYEYYVAPGAVRRRFALRRMLLALHRGWRDGVSSFSGAGGRNTPPRRVGDGAFGDGGNMLSGNNSGGGGGRGDGGGGVRSGDDDVQAAAGAAVGLRKSGDGIDGRKERGKSRPPASLSFDVFFPLFS